MNWKLALITLAVLPLIAYATKIFRDKVRDSYRRIRTAIARINAYMQEHVSGMVVLQLFNREQRSFDKFSEVNAVHMEAFKDAIMAHAVYYPVVEILSSTAIACVIWFGGNDIIRKLTVSSVAVDFSSQNLLSFHVVRTVVSIGILTAFIQYAQRFFRPIQDFSEKYNILQSAMAASERVFKLLDTHAEITSPAVTRTPTGPGRECAASCWARPEPLSHPPVTLDGCPRETACGSSPDGWTASSWATRWSAPTSAHPRSPRATCRAARSSGPTPTAST